MKVIVLLSGGLDSVTALHHSAREHNICGCLAFDYGSRHNHREIPCAQHHADSLGIPFTVIPLEFIARHFQSDLLLSGGPVPDGHYEEESMKRTVVPFRNGIMLSIAAGFAESTGAAGLVIAAHAGDHMIYPDCREEFMSAMAAAINLGSWAGITLLRPFIALSKGQIAARGAELGVDFSRTWSCYKGGDVHCGTCGTCVERREAFSLAGLEDPTVYQ